MGAHYKESGSIGTEQDVEIGEIIAHENFNPRNYRYDIALLKLAKPVTIGNGVSTICLPDTSFPLPFDNPNKKCYVTGWGTLTSGGSYPTVLMEASVPLVSASRCKQGYGAQKIFDSMLCAGLDLGGVDSCEGHSGGPLVCEFNGRWHLEGITSWAHGCAAPNQYGVYAYVRFLQSWVKSKMGKFEIKNTETKISMQQLSLLISLYFITEKPLLL